MTTQKNDWHREIDELPVRTDGLARTMKRVERRRTRSRIVSAAVGLTLAFGLVVGLVVVLTGSGSGHVTPGDSSTPGVSVTPSRTTGVQQDTSQFALATGEASIAHPDDWHLQTFTDTSCGFLTGGLVTNLSHDLVHPDLGPGACTYGWDEADWPSTAVVVQFATVQGNAFPSGSPRPDTPFPLNLGDAAQPGGGGSAEGFPVHVLYVWRGGEYVASLMVWIGPDATQADIQAARDAVASIGLVG